MTTQHSPLRQRMFEDMVYRKALPAHVSPEQRGIDVQHVAAHQTGFAAGFDRPLKNGPEPIRSPASAGR